MARTKGQKLRLALVLLAASPLLVAAVWMLVWMRQPRSFDFVSHFGGRRIPYPIILDPATERYRAGAERESVSYGFTADPRQVKAAMTQELESNGWTPFELDDEACEFYRGVTENSQRGVLPVKEIVSISDFAFFESDRSTLRVPAGTTCVVVVTKKTNGQELGMRLGRKK